MGNTGKQCRLGLFQDPDFAGDLEDSKSTSGGTLCVFGSHTFVPISWMCKKQTSVTHSSTESEIISLDLHQNIMRTILQERRDNSLQHYNLVHKFIPMPQAMKIREAKAAVDKAGNLNRDNGKWCCWMVGRFATQTPIFARWSLFFRSARDAQLEGY